jgi:hypothetical protein
MKPIRIAAGLLALTLALVILGPGLVFAHHGVASLGVAGVEGPGAPLETSTSATLPRGSYLVYGKLDYARFEKYTPEVDDESDYNAFWMYSLGYGLRSYLSLYAFVPFYTKTVEDNSYNTSGFADMSLMGILGFKYDDGLGLTPDNESLDDMEDWHFTVYGGASLPTGNADITDSDGNIDPGMSLGFGRPSSQLGVTATKTAGTRFTLVGESSYIAFSEYEYADGSKVRFGDELRFNGAFVARLLMSAPSEVRLDGSIEAGFLRLGRDELDGVGEAATGGDMLYATPGLRLYFKTMSFAAGVKLPVWTKLNEEADQQGAEGKESYRAIFTLSVLL